MQPQMTKWALVVLGVLLVGLVGLWFGYSLFLGTPKNGQTTPDGTGFLQDMPYTARNGSQTPPSSQSSPQSPDITGAYSSLFSQVGATGLTMTQVDSSSGGDSAAIYALYAADVSISKELYPKEGSYPIHAAFVDLNDDGTSEAVVYEDFPGFCGTVGCPLDIYQKQAGTWTKIFSTVTQGEVGLLNVYINNYRSLLLTLDTGGPRSRVVTYAWDGKTYQLGAVVATWDGMAFVLSR
jgi:hypothetical protein